MKKSTTVIVTFACLLALQQTLTAQLRPVAPPIVPDYAAKRTLLETDSLLLDLNDIQRNRKVPVKIYFPTTAPGPFPVVLFSHGLGGTRDGYAYLGSQWSASAYVVVHLQHIGSDDSVWRGSTRPIESLRSAITLKNA